MEKTENAMGTKKVMPLLISMSVPPMISMLIQALYNIVDSMYVARVSEDALTAVSIAFPLQNLIIAVSCGFGIGLKACAARALGAKDEKEVKYLKIQFNSIETVNSDFRVADGTFEKQ